MRGLSLKGAGSIFSRSGASAPPTGSAGLKLGRRNLLILSVAGTLLGALLWFLYLYTPTTLRSDELGVSIEGLESEIALGRAARADLPALREAVAGLEGERELFLAQLPQQNEVAELLDQLRGAAQETGVVFEALQNTGPAAEAAEGVRLLGFSLSTEGTYAQTIGFLRTLEALPRFTKVRRVGLVAGDAANDPLLSASYDFTVYVYTGLETTAEGGGEAEGDGAIAGEPLEDSAP